MDYIKKIRKKAASNPKSIVLPEGNEDRIIQAAREIARLGIANITLLGDDASICKKLGSSLLKKGKVEVINPRRYKDINRIIAGFHALRKAKGLSLKDAGKTIKDQSVYLAAMMVRMGLFDGFVAGAAHTTRNVAKAAIQCLERAPGVNLVSSSFIMGIKGAESVKEETFIFADCGIVPDPDYKQMAQIAIESAALAKSVLGMSPRVAMLSYSTKGSARGHFVDKVVRATEEARRMDPTLVIDGEMQLDAAIVPEVARLKAPRSKVAGKANVLIFPNLDSGNIAYKLTQRLANAKATGPVLQGLNRPASDLSRGCSIEDIVDTVAVTCVRAQNIERRK